MFGFMLALSIRQPYAELILRGIKTVEYRSRPTRRIGERFYIYAAKGSRRLSAFSHQPEQKIAGELPRGVIVGSAVIKSCRLSAISFQQEGIDREPTAEGGKPIYEWRLTAVKRYKRPRKLPRGVQPQPVWFQPFKKAA